MGMLDRTMGFEHARHHRQILRRESRTQVNRGAWIEWKLFKRFYVEIVVWLFQLVSFRAPTKV